MGMNLLDPLDLVSRPRRLRQTAAFRSLASETELRRDKIIYPLFISEGKKINKRHSIVSGMRTVSVDELPKVAEGLLKKGLEKLLLFGVVAKKDAKGSGALDSNGPVPQALKILRRSFPSLLLATDIALDPYTTHGHDGLMDGDRVLNDETVSVLAEMANLHADLGALIVSPSDMMDGRVAGIRLVLDENGFTDTAILSYTAKYASCLYGPFRETLDAKVKGDKKSYQMNFANRREAMRELVLDLEEGADMVMVKPASWYLDIISDFGASSEVPVVAYQVSGEAAMIELMAKNKLVNRSQAIEESLISIFRAGADCIVTYFGEDL